MKLDSNDYGFPSWFAAYKEAKKLGNNEVVLQRKFISLFEIAIGNHFVLPPPHQNIAELSITMQDLKILAFDELEPIIPSFGQCKDYSKTLYGEFPTTDIISELRHMLNEFYKIQNKE